MLFEKLYFFLRRFPWMIDLTQAQGERSFGLMLLSNGFQFSVIDVIPTLKATYNSISQIYSCKKMSALVSIRMDFWCSNYLRNVSVAESGPVCDQHHSSQRKCSGGKHEAWALFADRHDTHTTWPSNRNDEQGFKETTLEFVPCVYGLLKMCMPQKRNEWAGRA